MPGYTYTAVERPITWQASFGGYSTLTVTFDLTVKLRNDHLWLSATASNINVSVALGTQAGYGFLNVIGSMWGAQNFVYRDANPEGTAETWPSVKAEIEAHDPNILSESVVYAYLSDDNPPTYNGHGFGSSTFEVTFDEPVENDYQVLSGWFRYRDNDTAEAVTATGGTFSVNLGELLRDYFPGSARIGGEWISQNTEGYADCGRVSGSWVEIKNVKESASESTGFYRLNDAWNVLPLQS